jgi:ribosomal protein S19
MNSKKIIIIPRNKKIKKILLNKTILVHNGKTYKEIFITKSMIGYYCGSFCFTRIKHVYKK